MYHVELEDSKKLTEQESEFYAIDELRGGWSTRSYPHKIQDHQLSLLDNFTHVRDNLWTIRAGNINYANAAGTTGSGQPSQSGFRWYFGNPKAGQLVVQSNGHFYTGNDGTGAFTSRNAGMSTTVPATYAQMRDKDNGNAVTLFICDGSRVPQRWDGTTFSAVNTTSGFLPLGAVSGAPITPRFVCAWDHHLVYANEPTDPTAVWISDALFPERFHGTALVASDGTTYIPYYPAGQDADMGDITGIVAHGQFLFVFYTNGLAVGQNTGSYGSFQYIWWVLSRSIGTPSPQSIVELENVVAFWGGHWFYATDGVYIKRVSLELPTLGIQNNIAEQGAEIANNVTVSGWRNNDQIMWAYQSPQSPGTSQDRIVTFDMNANGGWDFIGERGGAWNRDIGMSVAWAAHCDGPGDNHQIFWGSSVADQIAQFNPSTPTVFTDFGSAIAFEIRTKSFFFDKPIHPKMVKGVYPIVAFTQQSNSFDAACTPYAIFDNGQKVEFTEATFMIAQVGTLYGSGAKYGTFLYEAGSGVSQQFMKTYPQGEPTQFPTGHSIAVGCTGSASTSFNILGFVIELSIEDVEQ